MSRTYEYRSGLASQISAFIAEKRACGCKYEKEAKTFQTLDRFLVEQGINTPVLPELVVEKWIEKRPNEKRKNQKWRLNFTKRFAKYLQLNGYAAYYPELTISSRDDADFSPCIFTSDELARIMKYFETMVPSRQCPTAHLVFPLLFKTLICCGLRAGEATRLRVKDVDLINGVLQIWETKHDKPRYVPLSKSLWADYEQYFEEIHAESSGNNYFFPNPRKSCYHTTTVYNRFRDALWHCGIAHKGRGYGPRVHDLRHTFAVRSMQKLKKSKSDIVTTLPYLSAYLGHCNMSATQIYLHLTAECYFDFEAYGRDARINDGGHFAPGGYVFNNGSSFVERYHGMEDIPPEHRIFAYPKLNIREQMAAYQEVIDRSALNEEKQRLPTSREDR